jgi:hypothetical protein
MNDDDGDGDACHLAVHVAVWCVWMLGYAGLGLTANSYNTFFFCVAIIISSSSSNIKTNLNDTSG